MYVHIYEGFSMEIFVNMRLTGSVSRTIHVNKGRAEAGSRLSFHAVHSPDVRPSNMCLKGHGANFISLLLGD